MLKSHSEMVLLFYGAGLTDKNIIISDPDISTGSDFFAVDFL